MTLSLSLYNSFSDCPSNGLCCFDGCSDRCLESSQQGRIKELFSNYLLFLPKHRGEEYKPSFQQHQRQRLRKLLLWRKPQNLKVTTILCQVRTHISYKNWTEKFYNLVSDLILWYLIKDLISIWRIWSLMTLRWAASSTKTPPTSPWTSHPLWSTANISCLHLSLFSYRSIHLLVNMLPLYPFNHLFQRAHIPLHWNFFRVLMLEKWSWTLYCVVWWGL